MLMASVLSVRNAFPGVSIPTLVLDLSLSSCEHGMRRSGYPTQQYNPVQNPTWLSALKVAFHRGLAHERACMGSSAVASALSFCASENRAHWPKWQVSLWQRSMMAASTVGSDDSHSVAACMQCSEPGGMPEVAVS